MKPLAAAALVAALAPGVAFGGTVGVTELRYDDATRARPLATLLWYPAADGASAATLSHDFIFRGYAAWDALPHAGRHPLVLLSHGDRGGKSNQAWLAEALAARGYLVAAVDHPGNTNRANTPEGTVRVWERPRDLSALLSALLADPAWGARIDAGRIAAAGHSSGGYTALALVGARYQPAQMRDYCVARAGAADCALARGARFDTIDFTDASADYRDARIRAAFAMAPALGPGLERQSLRGILAPVAIVAAEDDELLPHARHAAVTAASIPGARLLTIPAGGHFVFLPTCNLAGTVMMWFHRYDVCGRRHGDVERGAVHATVTAAAIRFFDDVLK